MTIVNLKPLAQDLTERIQSLFARHETAQNPVEPAHQPLSIEPESQAINADIAFLASIAHLPEAERVKCREWYAVLAAHQAVTDVEWREQRYQESGKALKRS